MSIYNPSWSSWWWHTIENEWSPLSQRSKLNFVWDWVNVTDNWVDTTIVTIPLTDISWKVPYTWATWSVDLWANKITLDWVSYNTNYTPNWLEPIWTRYWDTLTETTVLKTSSDTLLNDWAELSPLCKNWDSFTHLNWQPVYISSWTWKLWVVKLASASAENTSYAIYLATQDVVSTWNARWRYTQVWTVNGVPYTNVIATTDNYANWNEWTKLYLSTEAWKLTITRPVAPNHWVLIGQISDKSWNNISINTDIRVGYEVDELHDVDTSKSKTTPVDADSLFLQDSADSSIWKKLTWANVKATLKTYFDALYILMFKVYHWVTSRLTIAPLPTNLTTPVFTLGCTATSLTYYNQGISKTVSADYSLVLDDTLWATTTSWTLTSWKYYRIVNYVAWDNFTNIATTIRGTTNTTWYVFLATGTTPTTWTHWSSVKEITNSKGLYFVYFSDTNWTLTSSKTFPWLDGTNTLVSYVYWNWSNYGIVYDERHNHTRDIDWHGWAHTTIGCRYGSWLWFSFAWTTTANTTFSVSAWSIKDEDINFSISTQTQARTWYAASASEYVFNTTLSTTPYLFNGTWPIAIRNDTYATVAISSSSRYFNYFVCASTSCLAPIHIFAETIDPANVGGYTSVANARATTPPNIAATWLSPEYKLLYRVIVNWAWLVQALTTADDYRTTSTVGWSTIPSSTASSVTETNYGNVQTAINTLIAADAGFTPTSRTLTINWTWYDLSADRSWTITAWTTTPLALFEKPWTLVDWVLAKMIMNSSWTISSVLCGLESLPTWADAIIDIRKNWTAATDSIFTSDAWVTIATNATTTNWIYQATNSTIDNWTYVAWTVFYFFVKQKGSTLPWTGLSVTVMN